MAALTANLVILLFCSAAAEFWSSRHTHFILGLELSCSLTMKWCFRIVYVEVDRLTKDLIFHIGVICFNGHTWPKVLRGDQFGDGLSNFYDLELHIYHNCTTDGSIRFYNHVVGSLPVTELIHNTSISLDVTGKGIRVEHFPLV